MNQLFSFINSMDLIWIIPVLLFIHELEEWNILTWYKKYFVNLPASTETSVKIHIFTLGVAAFLLTLIARIAPLIIANILILFLSGFVLTNTIQHIIQTFQYKTYAPGLITGIITVAGCVFVNIILVRDGMIYLPFYAILLLGVPAVINTIKLKHQMTPELRRVHEFFIRVEKWVGRN